MRNRFTTEHILLVIVLAIGAMLRLYNYSSWSLSNDELSALARLRFPNYFEMIKQGVMLNDMHPLGVQTFLYVLTHLFGTNEAVVRLPFVLMGIISIYVFYRIGQSWFNSHISLLATTVFAFLQFPILYSQLARPYSPGLLFSLMAVYYFTTISKLDADADKRTITKAHVGFILSSVACMYTHYFSFMFVGIVGLCGLFIIQRSQLKWYLLSGVIMFVLYIPSIKTFIYHFSIGGLGGDGGWLGPPKSDAIWTYIKYCLNDSLLLLFILTSILILSVITRKGKIPFSKYQTLCIIYFIVPALVAYFYSIYKNPVFQYSILLFSFPYLLLFIFSFLPKFEWKPITIGAWFLILCMGVYSTVVGEKFYSTQHFGVFKNLVEQSMVYDKKYGKENITHTVNVISPYYINYYSEKLQQQSTYLQTSCTTPGALSQLDSIVQTSTTTYFVHAWSNTYDPPEAEQIIMQKFPFVVERINYFNSGITLFSKVLPDFKSSAIKPLFELNHDFETATLENDSAYRTSVVVHGGKYAVQLNKEREYSPTFKAALKDIGYKKGCTLQVSVWIHAVQIPLDANLVLSVDDKDKNVLWRGANAKEFITQANTWQRLFLAYRMTNDFNGDETIKLYVWNSGKSDFYIDDLQMQVIP